MCATRHHMRALDLLVHLEHECQAASRDLRWLQVCRRSCLEGLGIWPVRHHAAVEACACTAAFASKDRSLQSLKHLDKSQALQDIHSTPPAGQCSSFYRSTGGMNRLAASEARMRGDQQA